METKHSKQPMATIELILGEDNLMYLRTTHRISNGLIKDYQSRISLLRDKNNNHYDDNTKICISGLC